MDYYYSREDAVTGVDDVLMRRQSCDLSVVQAPDSLFGVKRRTASVRWEPLPAGIACHTEDQHDTTSRYPMGNCSQDTCPHVTGCRLNSLWSSLSWELEWEVPWHHRRRHSRVVVQEVHAASTVFSVHVAVSLWLSTMALWRTE